MFAVSGLKQKKILDIRAEKKNRSTAETTSTGKIISVPRMGWIQYRWFADHAKTDGLRAMERWDKALPSLSCLFFSLLSLWICKAVQLEPEAGSLKEIRWGLIPQNKTKMGGTAVFRQMLNPNLG